MTSKPEARWGQAPGQPMHSAGPLPCPDTPSKKGVSMQRMTAIVPQFKAPLSRLSCPGCGSPGPHQQGPGRGPHYARLLCGRCGSFLRWLPKPRLVVPEGGV